MLLKLRFGFDPDVKGRQRGQSELDLEGENWPERGPTQRVDHALAAIDSVATHALVQRLRDRSEER